jgi:hypothetical protein
VNAFGGRISAIGAQLQLVSDDARSGRASDRAFDAAIDNDQQIKLPTLRFPPWSPAGDPKSSALALRHQLGVTHLDGAVCEILSEFVVVLGKVQEGLANARLEHLP